MSDSAIGEKDAETLKCDNVFTMCSIAKRFSLAVISSAAAALGEVMG